MSNKEKAREIELSIQSRSVGEHSNEFEAAMQMAEWKDSQYRWGELMHEQAMNQDITNREFREMLENFPDDALICVECCNPRCMIYDLRYNLIRID